MDPKRPSRIVNDETLWSHGSVFIVVQQRASGRCRVFWYGDEGGATIATFFCKDWAGAVARCEQIKNEFLRAQGGCA
jgi:hypothetical protein